MVTSTITWDRLHQDARTLAADLLATPPPAGPVLGLVAISRGGLIPAAIVARELGCRLVESVCVATYDEQSQREPTLLKRPAAASDGAGWVIIDDLVDSGTTARLVRALLPGAHFACLYAKPAGEPIADRWVTRVPQDTWIHFPWDLAPQFVPPLARTSQKHP